MTELVKLIAAVMVANALTAVCIWGFIRMERYERRHGPLRMRFGDLVMVVAPPLAALYGLYLWGAFEATPFRHIIESPAAQHSPPPSRQ